jgi:heme exporter protein B
MFQIFKTIFVHELRLYFARKTEVINTLVFFLLTVILFPFGIGSETEFLKEVGEGIIWVTAILASSIGIARLFEPDYEDGTLALLKIQPIPIEIVVIAKMLANWAAFLLPVVLLCPIACGFFGIAAAKVWPLTLHLFIASIIFVLIGAVGASLALGSKKGRIMLSMIIMPFYVPIIIFGINSPDSTEILLGFLFFFLPIATFSASYIVRNS